MNSDIQGIYDARELGKPVIMHIRDAHGDALDLLRAHRRELPAGEEVFYK